MYSNSTGLTDVMAREYATRYNLLDKTTGQPVDPALVQPHTLSAAVQLKNGKNNYTLDFGDDANDRAASAQLLSKNDAFLVVSASLRVGKTPIINGVTQYGMTTWVTYPSPKLFAGAAVAGVAEKDCIAAIYSGGKLDWKAGSEEIIFEMLTDLLGYTPETQYDAVAGLLAATGDINDMARFRYINKEFGFIGGQRNQITLNIQNADTTQLEGDDAAFVNLVGIQLHGVIVRNGAEPMYMNGGGKAAYCCPS